MTVSLGSCSKKVDFVKRAERLGFLGDGPLFTCAEISS